MGLTWASIEMLAALSIEAAASKLPGAVLYGHSMGGLVAFEVCRQLSSRGEPLPLALIVGATAAPGSLPPVAEVCERLGINPNDDSPAGVRVRAGIERARVYVPHPVSLDLDVHIVLGREDRLVPARARGAWARIGCERLHIHRVEGGHLFHQTPHECLSRLLISVSRLKVS
jgi:medium-chain acyl-[acyl-carrier-protein] hydrolase